MDNLAELVQFEACEPTYLEKGWGHLLEKPRRATDDMDLEKAAMRAQYPLLPLPRGFAEGDVVYWASRDGSFGQRRSQSLLMAIGDHCRPKGKISRSRDPDGFCQQAIEATAEAICRVGTRAI